MVTVTKMYNLEIKGNLFAITEAEAQELFNALDCVLNNKTYPTPQQWNKDLTWKAVAESIVPNPWRAAEKRHKNNKYKL